jgi:hypothetical protein
MTLNLSIPNVKGCMIRDKGFLKTLYESQQILFTKKTLDSASDLELNTLIKILFYLSNGEIKITKDNFEKVSSKIKVIRSFTEKRSNVVKLLKSARKDKLKFLHKLNPFWPNLFHSLFNEI